MTYRWPTKFKRFGITDPSLRMLVAKHESEIPWQVQVRNEADLAAFVVEHMLPRQLRRIALPFEGTKGHCFVLPRHVDLELALATDQALDEDDVGILTLIRDENGADEARRELAGIVNARKAVAFGEWADLLTGFHADDPAFAVLLLRPLIEMAGAGSRRSVMPASADVVDWLHRRLRSGRLSPNDHFGKLYSWRLGAGTHRLPRDGWQHVPPGEQNVMQLVAASTGSGWCIADRHWAGRYIAKYRFYLLRHEGAPVVALRTELDGHVVEVQGRHNEPPDEWQADIDLFVRSQGLTVPDRMFEIDRERAFEASIEGKSNDWWLNRLRYWPFAATFAPPELRARLGMDTVAGIAAYADFPAFDRLSRDAGLTLTRADWIMLLAGRPDCHAAVPSEYREDAEVVAACATGWTDRLLDGDVTLDEARGIPDVVRLDRAFSVLLTESLRGEIGKRVCKRPNTAAERLRRFDLDKVLPPSPDESADIAVERVTSRLLANETADFSDAILPDTVRSRQDFAVVRERGWRQAVEAQPPMWFALPVDLVGRPGFVPSDAPVTRVDLDAWVEKVIDKPWLLTQQRGVPKSVRFHRRVLQAYFVGWMRRLREDPWRIWVPRGMGRRVYMSYAMLAAPAFPSEFAVGWRRHRRYMNRLWNKASVRMQALPPFQAAALRAIGDVKAVRMTQAELEVCVDIAKRQPQSRPGRCRPVGGPLEEEVRQRLLYAGFML